MKKIKIYFQGGLGNQLFQYAAGKKIKNENTNCNIDYYFHNYFSWSDFSVNLDYYLNIKNIKKISSIKDRLFHQINDCLFSYKIKEDFTNPIDFHKIPKRNFYTLQGYFQNYTWYANVLDEVCDEILLKSKNEIFDKFSDTELVIAFRRSDYIKFGWEINIDYYYEALNILNKNKEKKITIVSEDSQFNDLMYNKLKSEGYSLSPIKKILNFPRSVIDFTTLIKSKNLIMANSSFSWWAASIRSKMGYDNSCVILPKFWFPSSKNFHPGNPFKWIEVENLFV
jgi:hypothetical protein